MILGTWAQDDLRRAFVAGAAWWEWHEKNATMWNSDRRLAEEEAEKHYPNGKPISEQAAATGAAEEVKP